MESRVLLTAVELDVFSKIEDGADTPVKLARATGTHTRGMERLLKALTGLELLHNEGEKFRNSESARRFLVSKSPEYMGGPLLHYANLWKKWTMLTDVIRTGQLPAEQSIDRHTTDQTKAFMEAMTFFARERAPQIAELVDLSEAKRLIDIGGGPAIYSIEFCKRYPQLKATVLDLPAAIPFAEENIRAAGLSSRISTIAGDYRNENFGGDFDVALLFSILHINSPEENKHLLAKTFRCLNPGGLILIQEFIADDTKTQPPYVALFGINMLVNTQAGDVYSWEEIASWLAETGFVDSKLLCKFNDIGFITARKPKTD